MAGEPSRPRGHVAGPHTADVTIEAWAPTAAGCYEEALDAFVELFADTTTVRPEAAVSFEVGPDRPEELLVLLLEEVLAAVEARDAVPADAEVVVDGNRLLVTMSVVPISEVQPRGAVPKGVSHSELRFGLERDQWRCRAIVDV